MSTSLFRVVISGCALVIALVVQSTVLSRLPLPAGKPNVVLVLVVAVALTYGASVGMAFGFIAGLLSDLVSGHPAGVLALCFLAVGFVVGLLEADTNNLVYSLAVTGAAAIGSFIGYAAILSVVGDGVALRDLPLTALYDVMLVPFVLPVVNVVARRLAIQLR